MDTEEEGTLKKAKSQHIRKTYGIEGCEGVRERERVSM